MTAVLLARGHSAAEDLTDERQQHIAAALRPLAPLPTG
jgi:hypothetical protein